MIWLRIFKGRTSLCFIDNPLYNIAPTPFKSAINCKRALKDKTGGLGRSFVETGRYKYRDRLCYVCGSPDHLIRDCPAASIPFPMSQHENNTFMQPMPGYLSPFWNQIPYPQIRPFVIPYSNSVMTPHDAVMASAAAFTPIYMPSVYDGIPGYGGFTRMGDSSAAVGGDAEWYRHHVGCQDGPNKRSMFFNEIQRGRYMDADEHAGYGERHRYDESTRLSDPKPHRYRDETASYSASILGRRASRKQSHHQDLDDDREVASSKQEIQQRWKRSEASHRHRTECRNSKTRGGSPQSHHQGDKESRSKRKET